MDDNDDDLLGYDELTVRCDVLFRDSVDAVHDGFLERWDRNRDRRVTADEVPVVRYMRARLGL